MNQNPIKSNKRKIISLCLLFLCLFYSKSYAQDQNNLKIGAIPDQNPEILNRLYKILSNELEKQLGIKVKYVPVVNYQSAVTAFRNGNLDLVWFGGLTGVQARLQRPGAIVLAQRDIDAKFHTVFIANTKTKLNRFSSINELKQLKGHRFTFGSPSSTSGRLIPQYYLNKAGIKISDFKGGRAGYSGSHDTTIALVQSGAFEVGALNEQVWKKNLSMKRADPSKVIVIWRTPPYVDYHWLAQPNLEEKFGKGFTIKLKETIINFSKDSESQKQILDAFGAKKFIPAHAKEYKKIEEIGRKIGKIR